MTLIDLDRTAPPGPAPGRRPPPRRYRRAGLLLTMALAAALGGATPTAAVVWRHLGVLGPVSTAETPIQLAGGNLYTASSTGPAREITAWRLEPSPRRLWTSGVPVGASYDPIRGLFGGVTVRQAGNVVLVSEGFSTTALDADTGDVRWTGPVTVTLSGSGTVGVVIERVFRPGTEYDQASGDPGPLYFSATGVPHTEAPIRTEVRGVDLTSGTTVWTVTPGGSVSVDAVPGGPAAVLVTSSSRLTLLAAETGETLNEIDLPSLGGPGPSAGVVVGDLALIGYSSPSLQVAYDARTLRRLWDRDLSGPQGEPGDCTGVICSGARDDLAVLDPATGAEAWPANGERNLARRAGLVLETLAENDLPVRLAAPRTGETVVDLSGWTAALGGTPDGALLLRRAGERSGQTIAVVLPGQRGLTLLGTADVDGEECAADEQHLVCRDGTGLRVWAYRI